jgi:hypothetical protein
VNLINRFVREKQVRHHRACAARGVHLGGRVAVVAEDRSDVQTMYSGVQAATKDAAS